MPLLAGIALTTVCSVTAWAADEIAADGAGLCISTATPCVAVPVKWTRTDATPARGYSVTIELSPNLSLCGVQFASGSYLAPGNSPPPVFLVTPDGPNKWIVDEVTLGVPCGSTGNGTLFVANVTSATPTGNGTITITAATARDCNNAPIPANPGAAANIVIDQVAPAALALAATQKITGSLPAGSSTTDVTVSWTGPEPGATVAVYRKGFGGYPQYDENGGGVPTQPATPAAAITGGWTLTGLSTSPGDDRTATRDFYYYVVFTTDGCGNVSGPSALTAGALNYHLGDAHNGAANCTGDNLVNTSDVSFLGSHYGQNLALNDPLECLDIGPTTDFTVNARPTTDNRVNFEDLIVLAINFGQVSAPQAIGTPRLAMVAGNRLRLTSPELPGVGEIFAAALQFEGDGDVQGLSAQLDFDPAVLEFLGVEPGALLQAQAVPGIALSSGPGNVDVALLGRGGLSGAGELASARFRVRAAGTPRLGLRHAIARDGANQDVALDTASPVHVAAAPQRTALAPARPTPFESGTTLEYALARGGDVVLAIYEVSGRRIRTLARGAQEPGVYRIAWEGRDDAGRMVPAGMYYARLTTAEGRFARTLVKLR